MCHGVHVSREIYTKKEKRPSYNRTVKHKRNFNEYEESGNLPSYPKRYKR